MYSLIMVVFPTRTLVESFYNLFFFSLKKTVTEFVCTPNPTYQVARSPRIEYNRCDPSPVPDIVANAPACLNVNVNGQGRF